MISENSKGSRRTNYYRSGLSANDFRVAMSGSGWVSLTQIVGMLSDKIPPEAKARQYELRVSSKQPANNHTLERRLAIGCRKLIDLRLWTLVGDGHIEKKGKGTDAKYRWIESKDDTAQKDKA